MAKKKETRGRKPLDEANRKQEVRFFVENRFINAIGGLDESKKKAKELLEINALEVLAMENNDD